MDYSKEEILEFVEFVRDNSNSLMKKRNIFDEHKRHSEKTSTQMWYEKSKDGLIDIIKKEQDNSYYLRCTDLNKEMDYYSIALTNFTNEELRIGEDEEILKDTVHVFRKNGEKILEEENKAEKVSQLSEKLGSMNTSKPYKPAPEPEVSEEKTQRYKNKTTDTMKV